MNIKIDTNFRFSVASMQYLPSGELSITLVSDASPADAHYQYAASLGSGQAQEKPSVSLLQYARDFAAAADIKDKTKDTYRLMGIHLEAYGDRPIDRVTTAYLEGFVRRQLDSVFDPEGFATTYCYDILGRMTKRIHPDAGTTHYTYDNAGNLLEEINPLGQINYDYTYYRLLKKRYYMTFSRLGIVQTLRDLPSALGLSKTL